MRPQLEFSCPENWEKMTPVEGGRFCGSCEKVITDFSGMSNEEIIRQINSSGDHKSCGSFKAYQLEQPFNDGRNALIRFYHRLKAAKATLPKFISLGLVTALLFLSGCYRRTMGYCSPPRRDFKLGKHSYEQQSDSAKGHKRTRIRKTRLTW